jgi:hypothetical protein
VSERQRVVCGEGSAVESLMLVAGKNGHRIEAIL